MADGRTTLKSLYRPLVAGILRKMAGVVRLMPRRLALFVGDMIGAIAFRSARRARRRIDANLREAFRSDITSRSLFEISRSCFGTFGRSLMETLRLPVMTNDEILGLVDVSGFDEIERVLSRGKGVLILSAHIGSWEVLASWLGIKLGRPFHAIGRRMNYERYNDVLVDTRRKAGVETVYQDESPRKALGVLRANKALGILADQDIAQLDGVFVDFFSRPAHTPTAPVALARASGAGLVPVLTTWVGRRHHVHVLPEVELVRTKDRKADAVENTQRWSRAIEGLIRRYPGQWAWFHLRWRTKMTARS